MSERQKTVKQEFTITGKGLHTGLDVTLTVKPAPENHGYIFKRTDLEGEPTIRAIAENVVDTSRGTLLQEKENKVGTIEHLLAAMYSFGVDNALIEINAPEAPILDGSAKYYMEALEKTGLEEQSAPLEYFIVDKKIEYKNEEKGIHIVAYPDDKPSYNVNISYPSSVLSNQYAVLNDLSDFSKEISKCRTFVFLREIQPLLKAGLIKGGDLSNAIVIADTEVSQEELDQMADSLGKERVEVKYGVLNNIDLQFENEPARHKLLDLIGDLALTGMRIQGKIIATRPGHMANTEFAKILRKVVKKQQAGTVAPLIDTSKAPLMDINKIKTLLPHRWPFLLVDKIMEINQDESIIGVKNVSMNEQFFLGHFPEEPVMPGVLIVEAMAQVCGILVLDGVDEPERYSTYFLTIDKIKFRKKVVPGDTLIFRIEMMTPIRRGIANVKGRTYVGNDLVAEGEFMAQIVKNK